MRKAESTSALDDIKKAEDEQQQAALEAGNKTHFRELHSLAFTTTHIKIMRYFIMFRTTKLPNFSAFKTWLPGLYYVNQNLAMLLPFLLSSIGYRLSTTFSSSC